MDGENNTVSLISLKTARQFLEEIRTDVVANELFGRTCLFSQRHISQVFSSKEYGLDMDDFCQAATENTSITSIRLQVPEKPSGRQEEQTTKWIQTWSDFARAIGCLQNLREMELVFESGGQLLLEDMSLGIAALFIKRASRLETLHVNFVLSMHQDNECDAFALALQSHPSLKCLKFLQRTDQTSMDALSVQLGTMPQLSSIQFASLRGQGVQFRTLPDSFLDHLSTVSNLRHLALRQCVLTQQQCELLSGPLLNKNGGLKTLDLCDSMFLGSGGLAIARTLQKTNTLQQFSISLLGLDSKQVCEELSKAFLANTDLRLVSIESVSNGLSDANVFNRFEPTWFIPFFQALARLPALKELHVCDLDRWTDQVADEFRALLEHPKKSSIEILKILSYGRAPAWPRIEPCLNVNQTLRSLTLSNCMDSAEADQLVSRLKKGHSNNNEHPLEQLRVQTIDGRELHYHHLSRYSISEQHWCIATRGNERVPTDDKSSENEECYIADENDNNAAAISFDKQSKSSKRKYGELECCYCT